MPMQAIFTGSAFEVLQDMQRFLGMNGNDAVEPRCAPGSVGSTSDSEPTVAPAPKEGVQLDVTETSAPDNKNIVVTDLAGTETPFDKPGKASSFLAGLFEACVDIDQVVALDDANAHLIEILPEKNGKLVAASAKKMREKFAAEADAAEKKAAPGEDKANAPSDLEAVEAPKTFTIPDLNAAIREVVQKKGLPLAKSILNEFGANSIPEVKEADHAAFVARCRKEVGAGA